MNRIRSAQSGFSLLEAMIALFILSVSLLAIAQMLVLSLDKTEFSKSDTKAIQLAQAKAEELRLAFGREIATGTAAADLAAGSHGPEVVLLQSPDQRIQSQRTFQITWVVQDLGASRYGVAVTVTPGVDNPRQSESVTLSTRFTP